MNLNHPGFEFMVEDLQQAIPGARSDVLRRACEKADLVCHLVLTVPSAEVLCGAVSLFTDLETLSAEPEERAVFGTAADWACQALDKIYLSGTDRIS